MRSPMSASGIGDAGDVLHCGMREDQVLDLFGADLLAAAIDQVLLAAFDQIVAGPDSGASDRRSDRSRPRVNTLRCARARRNSRAACMVRARRTRRPRRTARRCPRRRAAHLVIGRDRPPDGFQPASSGSSGRTNISRPSDMPKFSCTNTLGISCLGRGCAPPAAVAGRRSGCSASSEVSNCVTSGLLISRIEQRRHHLDPGDPMPRNQRERPLRDRALAASTTRAVE